MQHSGLYYKASGKISPVGVLAFFLVSILGGGALSLLYLYLVRFVPLAMFDILFCVLFSPSLMLLFMFALRVGKVRNVIVAFFLVAIGIALVNYLKWALFVGVVLRFDTLANCLHPSHLLDDILQLNAIGTYVDASTGIPVTGSELARTWIAEALVITLPAFYAVKAALLPFSEETNRFYESVELPKKLRLVEERELQNFVAAIENGDCSVILKRETFAHKPDVNYAYIKLFKSNGENGGLIEVWNKPKAGRVNHIVKPVMIGKANADQIEKFLK